MHTVGGNVFVCGLSEEITLQYGIGMKLIHSQSLSVLYICFLC